MLSTDEIFNKWNEARTGSSMIILASSKSGKSTYMMDILNIYLSKDKNVIPIFITGNINAPIYDKYREKYPFFEGLNYGGIEIIETCKQINGSIDNKDRYNFLFILDDLVTGMRGAATINNLLLSYRNSGLSCICLIQNSTLLIKNARLNASCFLFGRSQKKEIMNLFDNYGLDHMEEFEDLTKDKDKIKRYQEMTQDYNFLAYFPLEGNDVLYKTKANN